MLRQVVQTFSRHYSRKTKEYKEVKIPLPWGSISGKWWAPFEERPVLTLHGWQDNCRTFDGLIPLLRDDIGFLTIDLPGHGYSSRLPLGLPYNNSLYPLIIHQISKFFNWPSVSLMGHSMGGVSCFTYAMFFPKKVDFCICIDGVKPLIPENNLELLTRSIGDFVKYDAQAADVSEPPAHDLGDLQRKLATLNNNSIEFKHTEMILQRNIARSKKDKTKYYVTRDPRLKLAFVYHWAQQDILKCAENITCPLLLIKSLESSYFEKKKNLYDLVDILKKVNKDMEMHYVEGTHHSVVNHPEGMQEIINGFLDKHKLRDRTSGGFTSEVVVSK